MYWDRHLIPPFSLYDFLGLFQFIKGRYYILIREFIEFRCRLLVVSLGGPTVPIFRSFLLVWPQRVFAPPTEPFLVSFSVLEISSGDYVSSLVSGLTLLFPSLFYRARVPPFAVFSFLSFLLVSVQQYNFLLLLILLPYNW